MNNVKPKLAIKQINNRDAVRVAIVLIRSPVSLLCLTNMLNITKGRGGGEEEVQPFNKVVVICTLFFLKKIAHATAT